METTELRAPLRELESAQQNGQANTDELPARAGPLLRPSSLPAPNSWLVGGPSRELLLVDLDLDDWPRDEI